MLMLPEREKLPDLEELHYEILEWIPTRSDGMARLVKARTLSGDIVTIKIARVDEHDALTNKHNHAILSESDCLAALAGGPGVVSVLPIPDADVNKSQYNHSLGANGSPAYLLQPFLGGGTLARFVGADPIPPSMALQIACSLAQTLEWVHHKQWVHRDLKPSNIMFVSSPDLKKPPYNPPQENAPILIDFGIAVPANTQTVAEGTISWMAPEVRRTFEENGTLDVRPACDMYGLGLILCYTLCGIRPTIALSAPENKKLLKEGAQAALSKSMSADGRVQKDLSDLIEALLDDRPENRPAASQVRNQMAKMLTRLSYRRAFSRQFIMARIRYASPYVRMIGSVAVALLTILLGQQLFGSSESDSTPSTVNAVVSVVETATVEPQLGFPTVHESPTPTLLPSIVEASASEEENVQFQNIEAEKERGKESLEDTSLQDDSEDVEVGIATPVEATSGINWLPDLSFGRQFFGNLLRLSTPVPTVEAAYAQPTPTPSISPTVTTIPNAFVFPEKAPIVEITGKNHPCIQDWQMTDTWNKYAPGNRIILQWRRIGRIPFDAEAKFQIGIALNEQDLTPYRAIPISNVVKEDSIEVDPMDALWAVHGVVEPQAVVNRPYVWGVFLVGASGKMVTRLSPACYFQLDGELRSNLPNG